MNVIATAIPDVLLLEPQRFDDARGFFSETWRRERFDAAVGRAVDFVQDNHSRSAKGVLRGLHFQNPVPQAKLVRVGRGAILDVAVDLRRSSPHFGQSVAEILSEDNRRQLFVPEGFAHGFVALNDVTDVFYKVAGAYAPQNEHCVIWNDPDLNISWGVADPIVSDKDARGVRLRDAALFD